MIGPPNPYKKWWLRSPYIDLSGYNSYAKHVDPSGDVDDFNYVVWDSYGRKKSPYTAVLYIGEWYVYPGGGLHYDNVHDYSYGIWWKKMLPNLSNIIGG